MGSQDIVGLVLIGLGFSLIGISLPPLINVDAFLEEVAQATW